MPHRRRCRRIPPPAVSGKTRALPPALQPRQGLKPQRPAQAPRTLAWGAELAARSVRPAAPRVPPQMLAAPVPEPPPALRAPEWASRGSPSPAVRRAPPRQRGQRRVLPPAEAPALRRHARHLPLLTPLSIPRLAPPLRRAPVWARRSQPIASPLLTFLFTH